MIRRVRKGVRKASRRSHQVKSRTQRLGRFAAGKEQICDRVYTSIEKMPLSLEAFVSNTSKLTDPILVNAS